MTISLKEFRIQLHEPMDGNDPLESLIIKNKTNTNMFDKSEYKFLF